MALHMISGRIFIFFLLYQREPLKHALFIMKNIAIKRVFVLKNRMCLSIWLRLRRKSVKGALALPLGFTV